MSSTPVDLVGLVRMLIGTFQRSHPTANIELSLARGLVALPRAVDPDAFAIVLNNLLENACRYGTPGGLITVTLEVDGIIIVENGVPHPLELELDVYRQRFKRGHSTQPGSGLGLAIVDRLMMQMNGTMQLSLEESETGENRFRCTLLFPASPASTSA